MCCAINGARLGLCIVLIRIIEPYILPNDTILPPLECWATSNQLTRRSTLHLAHQLDVLSLPIRSLNQPFIPHWHQWSKGTLSILASYIPFDHKPWNFAYVRDIFESFNQIDHLGEALLRNLCALKIDTLSEFREKFFLRQKVLGMTFQIFDRI
jgi:hypothetical protein